MSNRLGGFIAGQYVNIAIGTFTAVTSPTFTFASTSATPAVGQAVQFTTTGTLPTGLSLNTTYYVISVSTNTCQFSTTLGGSAVTFTNSSGSGTHTAVVPRAFNPYAGAPNTVDYLLVAGGGAGAGGVGGGGGAGGLLQGFGYAITPATAYTITIGAGGTAGASESTQGSSGSNSVFGSQFTAIGGGLGGSAAAGGGATGGSGGGGAGSSSLNGFAGTIGQGNTGGGGNSAGCGGGGGGSGSAGFAPTAFALGAGGAGTVSTITGQPVQYAGGGGGGNYWNGTGTSGIAVYPGASGAAGGGDGGTSYNPSSTGSNAPQNGTAAKSNSGSGGGGATGNGASNMATGGNGGSGIFVLRYPQINAAPVMVTGSPQIRYADGYQIYIWTSSGSIIF